MVKRRTYFRVCDLARSCALVSVVFQSLFAAAQQSNSDDCAPVPIALPITNVTLPSGRTRRGVSIGLGQPVKQYSVLPSWQNNNTFIFGPDCDYDDDKERCDTFRGGLYDPDKSDSDGTLNSDHDGPSEPWPSNTYRLFTENLTLADDVFVEDFPFARPTNTKDWDLQGYRPQHMIGMQGGSTVLKSLVEANSIASRSWGWFWGLDGRGQSDQSSGSMVLGGYDRAKTYGDGYTRQMETNDACQSSMLVVLEDIVLNLDNGTNVSLFNTEESGGQSLRVCLEPSLPVLMDLPYKPYFSEWQVVLGHLLEFGRSTGVDYWNIIMSEDAAGYGTYTGDLTLDFGSNFRITIPNDHIVVPERKIDDKGNLYANASAPVLRINSLQDATRSSFPRLGKYFFTQAYLFCNEDAREFTLWSSNPTSSTDLVAVNSEGQRVTSGDDCPARTSPAPPSQETPDKNGEETPPPNSGDSGSDGSSGSDNSSGSGDSTISPGAIAGAAVGGSVAGGMILAGIFFYWRRRRAVKKQALAQNQPPPAWSPPEHKSPSSQDFQGYPHFIPQELHNTPRRSSQPFEMAA